MRSRTKLIIAALAATKITCVVAAVAIGFFGKTKTEWPDFLTDKAGAPQYNYEVAERDFGYRTGNHVPVVLYFKLKPGMELLADQFVIGGDFQEVSRKELREQHGDDTLVRLELTLQTFELKPRLEVKPTIAYRNGNSETKKLDIGPVEVYTSATYDGRKDKHPKELALTEVSGGHLRVTFAFILVGVAGILLSLRAMAWRERRPRAKKEPAHKPVKSPFPQGWTQVQEAWAAITRGDRSKAAFRRVVDLTRTFFGAATLTVSEVKRSAIAEKDALSDFLAAAERTLWTDKPVQDGDISTADGAMKELEARLLERDKPAAN